MRTRQKDRQRWRKRRKQSDCISFRFFFLCGTSTCVLPPCGCPFRPIYIFNSFFVFCLRLRVIARCGIIHTTSWQKAERAYDEFAKELVDDNGERPPLNHPSLYDQENVDKTCGSSSIIGSNTASSLLSSSASSAAAQGTSTELVRNSNFGVIKKTSKYSGVSFDQKGKAFRCQIRLKSLGKTYQKRFKVDKHGEEGAEMLAGKFQ